MSRLSATSHRITPATAHLHFGTSAFCRPGIRRVPSMLFWAAAEHAVVQAAPQVEEGIAPRSRTTWYMLRAALVGQVEAVDWTDEDEAAADRSEAWLCDEWAQEEEKERGDI